jgi:uncharacterized SAM-binding protein YcdF (DUF218 family)
LAKQVFFTGGWCKEIQGDHAWRGRTLAVAAGVPEAAVVGDADAVHSTYAEAVRLRAFIAGSPVPIRSVIVVSDPFHMRRARWTYREVLGGGVRVEMAPIPFQNTPYRQRWWEDPLSQQYVADEYKKMVYYYARYRLSWGPVQTWLASFDTD